MGALSDVTVLDMSRIMAGPFGTQILADLGATVWKIESPWGDDTRGWGPPFVGGESAYYLSANRGKKSLIVNLRDPRGQEIIRKMAQKSDILVENFRVGNLKRYGLDYESISAINPGIVYASVTGFGQTGPRASEPGYDAALQGMTGVMSVTGEADGRPTKVGVAWVDILTGLTTTIGILAALHESKLSGRGTARRRVAVRRRYRVHGEPGAEFPGNGRSSGAHGKRASTGGSVPGLPGVGRLVHDCGQ